MPNQNKVILEGYVSNEPEMKFSNEGTEIMNFSLATNNHFTKNGKEVSTVDYHRVVMFSKLAKKFYGKIKKGDNLHLEGRIKYSSWEDSDGNTKYSTNIVVNRCHIIKSVKNDDELNGDY